MSPPAAPRGRYLAVNKRAFWTSIYTKLLPLQVTGQDGRPIEHTLDMKVQIVRETLKEIDGTTRGPSGVDIDAVGA